MKLSLVVSVGLLSLAVQVVQAVMPIYDSKLDYFPGSMTPAGAWRYQYADVGDGTGPYPDLPFWSFENECWQLGFSWPPYLYFYPENFHPETAQDAVGTFLPPARGKYAVMGALQPGFSVQFSLTQGLKTGADAVLAASPASVFRKWGAFRVITVTNNVRPTDGEGQLHFRLNSLGDNSNDDTGYRCLFYRLGTEVAPPSYATSFEEAFGSGKPVDYGEGLGQLGDRDPLGNPVWFYQAGMPGQAENFELLARWTEVEYTSDDQDFDWALCAAGAGSVHPGPTEAQSTIITWCSPYESMKVSISCAALQASGGDGVLVRIYKNNELLPHCTLDNVDAGGTIGARRLDVEPGDCLHVAVSPKGDHYNDLTTLSVTVARVPANPGTLVVLW